MTTQRIAAIRAQLESLEGAAGYSDTATRRYLKLEREDALKSDALGIERYSVVRDREVRAKALAVSAAQAIADAAWHAANTAAVPVLEGILSADGQPVSAGYTAAGVALTVVVRVSDSQELAVTSNRDYADFAEGGASFTTMVAKPCTLATSEWLPVEFSEPFWFSGWAQSSIDSDWLSMEIEAARAKKSAKKAVADPVVAAQNAFSEFFGARA